MYLHVVRDRDVLRATLHTVAAAGAQGVHFLGNVGAHAVKIIVGIWFCSLGDPAGCVYMPFFCKTHQSNGNLGAAYAESQRRVGRCLIAVGKEGQLLLMLRYQAARERIHGDDAESEFAGRAHNADGNLTSVGNEKLFHRMLDGEKKRQSIAMRRSLLRGGPHANRKMPSKSL